MGMQVLALMGGIVAFLSGLLLIYGVTRGSFHLSVATMALWSIIDGSILLASLASGATVPFLSAGLFTGTLLLTFVLFFKGNWKWGMLENICTIVTLVCLVLWYIAGPIFALVSLTIGKYLVAGAPNAIAAYKRPEPRQAPPWLMGLFASGTNIFTLGTWTMAESFFPTAAFAFSLLISSIHLFHKIDNKQAME